jgi:hypothetical protein
MYVPSRAVMTEWQRAGVFGHGPRGNYGAISENNEQQPNRRMITIDELLELEDRAQRIELFDSLTLESLTFTELMSAAIPSQMFIRVFFQHEFYNGVAGLDPNGVPLESEDFELPPDLLMAWNIAMVFLLWMIGVTLFVTIMIFVKIQSDT